MVREQVSSKKEIITIIKRVFPKDTAERGSYIDIHTLMLDSASKVNRLPLHYSKAYPVVPPYLIESWPIPVDSNILLKTQEENTLADLRVDPVPRIRSASHRPLR